MRSWSLESNKAHLTAGLFFTEVGYPVKCEGRFPATSG